MFFVTRVFLISYFQSLFSLHISCHIIPSHPFLFGQSYKRDNKDRSPPHTRASKGLRISERNISVVQYRILSWWKAPGPSQIAHCVYLSFRRREVGYSQTHLRKLVPKGRVAQTPLSVKLLIESNRVSVDSRWVIHKHNSQKLPQVGRVA